ncbi:hypothetical protein Y032_0034g2896 [Ancylostoma ceylanicum]|nr:hypothetical protein Y032_0034g2896 [Ancylostoma ceylanicum]
MEYVECTSTSAIGGISGRCALILNEDSGGGSSDGADINLCCARHKDCYKQRTGFRPCDVQLCLCLEEVDLYIFTGADDCSFQLINRMQVTMILVNLSCKDPPRILYWILVPAISNAAGKAVLWELQALIDKKDGCGYKIYKSCTDGRRFGAKYYESMDDTKFEKIYPKEFKTSALDQVYRRCRQTAFATKACLANYLACLTNRNPKECAKEMKECSTGCVAINATSHCEFALNSFFEGIDAEKIPEEPDLPRPEEPKPDRPLPGPEQPKPERPKEPDSITRAVGVGGTPRPHSGLIVDKESPKSSEKSSSNGFLNDTFALGAIVILAGVVLIQGCFLIMMRRQNRVHPTSAKGHSSSVTDATV